MPYKQGKKWRATPWHNGERLSTALFTTKKAASEWEREKIKEARKAEKLLRKGLDLLTICSEYVIEARRYTDKTYGEKKNVCNRLMKFIGGDRIVEPVDEQGRVALLKDIKEFLRIQVNTRSPNASNKDRKNLNAMWVWAKDLGVKHNPIAATKKYAHDKQPRYVPPVENILKILMVANRKERIFLDCYIHTGARRAEIFKLLWDDVNFNERSIRLGTHKTRDGSVKFRYIDMNDRLYESLWWHWNNREDKISPYVFISDQPGQHYGKPYKYRQKFMKGLCKRAGVTPFGFHALRHFFASTLDSKNIPLRKIQALLGHEKATTTDHYLHELKGEKTTATDVILEKLDEGKKIFTPGTTPNDKGANRGND